MSTTYKWIVIVVVIILIIAGVWYYGAKPSVSVETGPIKIGATLPLTGVASIYGQYNKEGMELALAEINNQGGINGRQLAIRYEDTQSKNTNAVSATQKFINVDKVSAILGSPPSSEVLAEAPVAEKAKTVLIVAGGGVPSLRDAGDYIFRVKVSIDKEIGELQKLVSDKFKARSAYILYVQNDYGEGTRKFVSQMFPNSGIKIVGSEGFGANETDYRSQLLKIKEAHPDIVVLSGWPNHLGYILKQANELGIKERFVTTGGSIGPDILTIAGPSANGLIYTMEFDVNRNVDSTKNFRKSYKEKYGRDPELFAAMSYDETEIIAKMFEICGEKSTCIKDNLYKVQNYDGVSGVISFDDHGDVLKPMVYMTVKNGQFVPYE